MKHPLLLAALCATGAVAVLSGVAIAAFAAPVGAQTATVRDVAPLTVPLGHHPTRFATPPVSKSNTDDNLVVVAVVGAQTLNNTPSARGSSQSDSPSAARASDEGPTSAPETAPPVNVRAKTAPDDSAATPATPAKAEDSGENSVMGSSTKDSGNGSTTEDESGKKDK